MQSIEESSQKKKDLSEEFSESDSLRKEKKSDADDPKPRIVLTFRSDKSGAKNANMKIVSTEEKHEDVTPRRSSRAKSRWESDDDTEILITSKKDRTLSQPVSENDEVSDNSHTSKRSTRQQSKDCPEVSGSVLNRTEKTINETATRTQRLFRRIKPTAKVLENEELLIGLESQNNLRLGITPDKTNSEGVRTRRSTHSKNVKSLVESNKHSNNKEKTEDKHHVENNAKKDNSVKKLKHLCELGLKANNTKSDEDSASDNRESCDNQESRGDDDEEIDDDTEVISKLLQADEESGTSSSEEESICSDEVDEIKPKRSRRLSSSNESVDSSQDQEDEPKTPPRRSKRLNNSHSNNAAPWYIDSDSRDIEYKPKTKKRRSHSEIVDYVSDNEEDEKSTPADADEGSAPASPIESNKVVAECCCVESSNVHAAPSELTDPVFCQAVETVEDMRVGCCHQAARECKGGQLLPMLRAGPRAPYFLACRLHAAQLAKHMCCPLCGLFCTHGEFYQCSKGHFFHVDCALPREISDSKHKEGCPHCGVYSYRWVPVNTECHRVKVEMHCTNKQVYLPDQREQSTPAFLGFSTLDPTKLDTGPLVPEDLLPATDIKQLCDAHLEEDGSCVETLYEAILAEETIEQIIPKIVRGERLNAAAGGVDGSTCAHAAAVCARPDILYALQCAGAHLDALDARARTPLMRAIMALLEKETPEIPDEEHNLDGLAEDKEDADEDKCDDIDDKGDTVEGKSKHDENVDGENEDRSGESDDKAVDQDKSKEEDFIKVIRFLVAAGCDVNISGPEGMSALHLAAQHGGAEVCSVLINAGAKVDARDQGAWTPLVRAAENGHTAVVKLLLSAGADASVTDGEGHGAVHWCALAGHARCLQLLLDAAPHTVSAANAHTDTPMHVAAREGHHACVVILLARGARTDIENSSGELPVEVCEGACRSAISLNMQMALAVRGSLARHRMLSGDISNGRETHPVACVNEVDDAALPEDFTYVARHVLPAQLPVDYTLQTMQGCECSGGDCSDSACGCCVLGVRSWYVAGRLPPNFPYHDPPMLFECNITCACNMKRCGNRVVSRVEAEGSLGARVQVFRTARCGWGLRARQPLRRGQCVALYCGELLASRDADARAMDHYMFALDLKRDLLQQCEEQSALCVDAARYGSAARFVNHSCRPNLSPLRVFTGCRDLRLPVVALFAIRDVPAFDELTFDYGDKFWSVKSKWMHCECDAPDCRYPTKEDGES